MDISQIDSMIEQYIQSGGDMAALDRMYQTRTSTGKTPLGLNRWELWNKPSMADFNEDNRIIDEELRRLQGEKVNGKWTMYSHLSELGITAANETIQNIVTNMATNSMLFTYVSTQGSNADIYPNAYGTLQVVKVNEARTIIWFYNESGGKMWTGQYYQPSNLWGGWTQVGSAKPPEEHMLSVSSGYSSDARFCKEDNGILHLYGCLIISSGTIPTNAVVATLPAGYRPSNDLTLPASYYGSGGFSGGGIKIKANGQIEARSPSSPCAYMYLGLSFLTAQ